MPDALPDGHVFIAVGGDPAGLATLLKLGQKRVPELSLLAAIEFPAPGEIPIRLKLEDGDTVVLRVRTEPG